MQNQPYCHNGIHVYPEQAKQGEKLTIQYDGLLQKSGAEHVLAHVAYNANWKSPCDYPMAKSQDGMFETVITVEGGSTLNLAFKDCASNWDNNEGKNYTFVIK